MHLRRTNANSGTTLCLIASPLNTAFGLLSFGTCSADDSIYPHEHVMRFGVCCLICNEPCDSGSMISLFKESLLAFAMVGIALHASPALCSFRFGSCRARCRWASTPAQMDFPPNVMKRKRRRQHRLAKADSGKCEIHIDDCGPELRSGPLFGGFGRSRVAVSVSGPMPRNRDARRSRGERVGERREAQTLVRPRLCSGPWRRRCRRGPEPT